MKKSLIAVFVVMFALTGCDRDRMSEVGFKLPDGDANAGREAFVYMQCHQCHTVSGDDFPPVEFAEEPYVHLGGPVTRVKTYGQLVTAIIHPSDKLIKGYDREAVSEDGESKMYNYNEYMTVKELVDIVMYLQPHYDLVVPNMNYRWHP